MHSSLNSDDILKLLARELAESELKATAVSLGCCCRRFGDPVLNELWKTQDRLTPLLKQLPQEVWEEEEGIFVSQWMVSYLPPRSTMFLKAFLETPNESAVGQCPKTCSKNEAAQIASQR